LHLHSLGVLVVLSIRRGQVLDARCHRRIGEITGKVTVTDELAGVTDLGRGE